MSVKTRFEGSTQAPLPLLNTILRNHGSQAPGSVGGLLDVAAVARRRRIFLFESPCIKLTLIPALIFTANRSLHQLPGRRNPPCFLG